jgi:hypothetical protein
VNRRRVKREDAPDSYERLRVTVKVAQARKGSSSVYGAILQPVSGTSPVPVAAGSEVRSFGRFDWRRHGGARRSEGARRRAQRSGRRGCGRRRDHLPRLHSRALVYEPEYLLRPPDSDGATKRSRAPYVLPQGRRAAACQPRWGGQERSSLPRPATRPCVSGELPATGKRVPLRTTAPQYRRADV